MKIRIGDDPLTEKETHVINECQLGIYNILLNDEWILCLAFEELDRRTLIPMTTDHSQEFEIQQLINHIKEVRRHGNDNS